MADKTGYIGRNPNESNSAIVRQTYSLTSNTTELSFTAGYIVGFVDVYVNGVKLIDVQDYSATNASTITLTTAAVSGDVVEIVAYKALNVGNVENANGNFTVGSNLSVGSTATLSGVTTCEGDLYVGGDLYVLDDIVYDEVTGRNLNITGVATAATIHVGSATTIDGSGVNVTGVITATSFSGDGSALTGVAATDYIVSNTLKVVGISTFSGEVQVGTAVTIGVAGVTTFSNGVHLDGTTIFGKGNAIRLENGFENENAQIQNDGATEKATIVFKTSSGGTVSERLRIKDTGDVDLSGSAAGLSSVTWDASADSLIFKDGSYAKFGDSSDLSIYHDGTNSYISDTGTGSLIIKDDAQIVLQADILRLKNEAGNNSYITGDNGAAVGLRYNNTERLTTTNNGINVIGISSASQSVHVADTITADGGTGIITATQYKGDGSALTGVGGEFDITSCLFI